MTAPDPSTVDPNAWADAALKLFAGAGWVIPALIAFYFLCKYPPWRRKKASDDD